MAKFKEFIIEEANEVKKSYWIAKIQYTGTASVAIESDKRPSSDQIRNQLGSGKADKGTAHYNLMQMDVYKASEQEYRRVKK